MLLAICEKKLAIFASTGNYFRPWRSGGVSGTVATPLVSDLQKRFEIGCRNPDFAMFDSTVNHKDLIFQDATVRLVHISPMNQTYTTYLGPNFVRSMQLMASIDCVTGSTASAVHSFALLSALTGLLAVNTLLSLCIW